MGSHVGNYVGQDLENSKWDEHTHTLVILVLLSVLIDLATKGSTTAGAERITRKLPASKTKNKSSKPVMGAVADIFCSDDDDGVDYVKDYLVKTDGHEDGYSTDSNEYDKEELSDQNELVESIEREFQEVQKTLLQEAQECKNFKEQDEVLRRLKDARTQHEKLLHQILRTASRKGNRVWTKAE